ncbi:MAG: glycosyltransferase family 9 protein [Ignavibacteriae bacterium]|nr:glycosyltransferase family 9 protein [Ignavibacteriota bacterium]
MINSLPKRILIVQVGKIGDMILTTPLFSELKNLFPDCEIYVLTGRVNNEIALRDKNISGTIVYKKNAFSVLKLIFTLKKLKFDYWIDTKDEYSSTSKTLLKFGKFSESLGFNIKENIFNISLKEFVKGEHTVNINLSPISYFKKDYEIKTLRPSINIPTEISDKYSEIFSKINTKKILINVSAGAENRYWKTEKWLKLINEIEKEYCLLLISDFKDKNLADQIIAGYKGNNLTYISADNIFEVSEIVRNCDVIVTPDTSVVHLASCFNKPIVAMFHNVEWVIKRYAPLSYKSKIITSKEKDSIEDISVEEVLENLKSLL